MKSTSIRVVFLVAMVCLVALATAQSSGAKSKRKNQRRQQVPSKVQKATARIIGPNGVEGTVTFECEVINCELFSFVDII